MRKYLFIIAVVVIIIVVGLVLAGRGKTPTFTKIRVGHIGLANDLPAYVAKEKGFFQQEGLDVELTKLENSKLVSDGLYNGSLDASAGSSLVNFLAAEANDPGKIKFYALGHTGKSETTTLGAFVVQDKSAIKSEKDLADKKIGVFPGNTAQSLLTHYLTNLGVDTSKIQWQKMPPANWIGALDTGAIDALFAYEPTLTILKNRVEPKVRVFGYGALEDLADPLYLGGSTLAVRFINEHPDAAKAYVRAYYKGIDFIENNPDQARQIFGSAQYRNLDPEISAKMNLYPDDKVGQIQRDKFQVLADFLFETKDIPVRIDVARNDLYLSQ